VRIHQRLLSRIAESPHSASQVRGGSPTTLERRAVDRPRVSRTRRGARQGGGTGSRTSPASPRAYDGRLSSERTATRGPASNSPSAEASIVSGRTGAVLATSARRELSMIRGREMTADKFAAIESASRFCRRFCRPPTMVRREGISTRSSDRPHRSAIDRPR